MMNVPVTIDKLATESIISKDALSIETLLDVSEKAGIATRFQALCVAIAVA